jgi:hypothetical protein
MTKMSGLGDNFYIGGYDLSGDVSAFSQIGGGPVLLDVTPVKSSANQRIGGLRTGDLQFTTFFEFAGSGSAPSFPGSGTAVTSTYPVNVLAVITGGTVGTVNVNGGSAGTGDGAYLIPPLGSISSTYTGSPSWTWALQGTEHDFLSTLPRTDVIASYFRGTTLLNPTASLFGRQLNYDPTRDATGNLTMAVEVQSDGYGLEWGVQLTAGLRTDITGTTGAYVDDNGAASSYGAQAYLQIVEFAGTSVDVKIEHSTTSGSGYASLIDFGSQTGIGAWRGAATGTVDRYLEVVTSGTFEYVTFAVAWTRNQTAVSF